MTKINFEAPGIYLLPDHLFEHEELTFGSYSAFVKGYLGSSHTNGEWTLFLDGILTNRPNNGLSDAGFALELFLEKGVSEVQKLEGFYNVLLIHESGNELYFFSDLLCNRTWYLYQKDDLTALSPTPLTFSDLNMETSFNEQAFYEQIRLLHTGSDRTLVNEIGRTLPGYVYKLSEDQLEKKVNVPFTQRTDDSLDLEDCTHAMVDLCRKSISGVLDHPKLSELPVQLPLTGGLDSRHLLGELYAQNNPPELLRHILIQNKDYVPVKEIAKDLELPLKVDTFETMDMKALLSWWISRSGGLINIHQFYLINLKNDLKDRKHVSFNGYLMDLLLGLAVKTDKLDPEAPYKPVWNRTYSSPTIRRLLIPNAKYWEQETEQIFKNEIEEFQGEPWFKMLMLDIHHRGLHYTGIVDSMLADEVFSFSPGATYQAYVFASTSPHEVAGDKRAKLKALQEHFPEMAKYKGVEGTSFADMEMRPEIIEHPVIKNVKAVLKTVLSGFRTNYNSESEHSWIRNNTNLHHIHKKMVSDSSLVKDGYVRRVGLSICWKINQMGGYQGWTLMSLLSAEISYRILIKKEAPERVLNWLFSPIK